MDEEAPADETPVLEDKTLTWRRDELRRLGYNSKQRKKLMELMERRELDLHTVQHLGDDLHWPAEKAWWVVS